MAYVEIFTLKSCSYCIKAKDLLKKKGVLFTEYQMDESESNKNILQLRSDKKTVPQIFINSQYIGGCSDLFDLEEISCLDPLLEI
jgi:glutaredoxin 3